MNAIKFFWSVAVLLCCLNSCAQTSRLESSCDAPKHDAWTKLLQTHVDSFGWVSYKGFRSDSLALDAYLNLLAACEPNDSWTKTESLAYWINVYNAFTVKLILDHYPTSSIKDIKSGIPFVNSVWDINFIPIGGRILSLNDVEHNILRKEFEEPRIHFAIVCASKSCPQLLKEAYEANKLEAQLESQARNFINDKTKNEIEAEEIRISPIFKWFTSDFTKNSSLKEFIARYADIDFSSDAKVKYRKYDWSLNGN